MSEARDHFRASYHDQFGPDIGELALDADFGGANGTGLCPVGERQAAETDGYYGGCGSSLCPVCNFCFKWHHPKDRHGDESDVY